MDRKFAWNRVSLLPMAVFGIVHEAFRNGIRLSIFRNSISITNCEMPLLP
ncbi:RAxF-45 family protein [Paenibacillus motobuensis]